MSCLLRKLSSAVENLAYCIPSILLKQCERKISMYIVISLALWVLTGLSSRIVSFLSCHPAGIHPSAALVMCSRSWTHCAFISSRKDVQSPRRTWKFKLQILSRCCMCPSQRCDWDRAVCSQSVTNLRTPGYDDADQNHDGDGNVGGDEDDDDDDYGENGWMGTATW